MSSRISCVTRRRFTFTNFPPEIVHCIIDIFLDANSLHKEESWQWDYWYKHEPEHNLLQVYVDALILAATYARDNQSTALLVSAKRNDIAGVIRALHMGANIHSDDATETVTYNTTGPNAIKTGHRVPLYLEKKVTAIHWSPFNGHKEIVSLLLNHGTDINHMVSIDTRGGLSVRSRRLFRYTSIVLPLVAMRNLSLAPKHPIISKCLALSMCILLQVDVQDLPEQLVDIELHGSSLDTVLHDLSSEVICPVKRHDCTATDLSIDGREPGEVEFRSFGAIISVNVADARGQDVYTCFEKVLYLLWRSK
ncbi:hypothetical protein FGADI_610 [Fusarium gaditjirri]|uniref:Ankyrin repeat protein n=1 Tax=Fusarium gaditjirri TaxID=282569 RepID=A0A8H4TN57_9HYPO|nr:hypothetical protein FGADI_610 [Fusarium gaditjirri]